MSQKIKVRTDEEGKTFLTLFTDQKSSETRGLTEGQGCCCCTCISPRFYWSLAEPGQTS